MSFRAERWVAGIALLVLAATAAVWLVQRGAAQPVQSLWTHAAARWAGEDAASGPLPSAPGPAPGLEEAPAEAGRAEGSVGEPAGVLAVHVAGQVRRPGLYRLPAGSRVADAVEAAGGPAEGAWLDGINLAAPLADGVQVYVPGRDQADMGIPGGPGASRGFLGPPLPLDLNRATAEQLEALPGIGPALAERIVAYRRQHGPFRRLEDLTRVSGVGPKTVEALRAYVTVR